MDEKKFYSCACCVHYVAYGEERDDDDYHFECELAVIGECHYVPNNPLRTCIIDCGRCPFNPSES